MPNSDGDTDTGEYSGDFRDFALSYEPTFLEILEAVLNVSNAEARTYFAVSEHQNVDVSSLADEIDRAESTVRVQLAKLRETELVSRDIRVPERGTHHTYQARPLTEVRSILHEAVDRWVFDVVHRIEHLTEDMSDESFDRRAEAATASTSDAVDVSAFDASAVARRALNDEIPSLRSVATCVFGFRYPELKLYLVLLDHPRSTAQELAEVQDLARPTVVGRLNALQDRGLAQPEARVTEIGNSIAYEYLPRPVDETKEAMIEQLHGEWIEYAHRCIDDANLPPVEYRD